MRLAVVEVRAALYSAPTMGSHVVDSSATRSEHGGMQDDGTRLTTPEVQRAPWWLAGKELRQTVLLECLWTAWFVLHLIEVLTGGLTGVIGTVLLVGSGILMVGIVPSIVWHARRIPVYA
jgi:hypothetical protein